MGSPINNSSFNRTAKKNDEEQAICAGGRNNVRMGEISIEGEKKGVKKKHKAAVSPRARTERPKAKFKGPAGRITALLPGRTITVQKQPRIPAEGAHWAELVDLDTLADPKKTERDEAVATLGQAIDYLKFLVEFLGREQMLPTLDLAREILAQRSMETAPETSRYFGEPSGKIERKDAAGRPAEAVPETPRYFKAEEYDKILARVRNVLFGTARDRLKLGDVLEALQNIHEEFEEIRTARGAVTKEEKAKFAGLIDDCIEPLNVAIDTASSAKGEAEKARTTPGLDWAYPKDVPERFKELEGFLSNALKEAGSLKDRIGKS